MSTFTPRICRCPSCGEPLSREIVVSLNGAQRPDLIDAILADGFQVYDCGCGCAYAVDDPFVFIDFERGHWIAQVPAALERGWHRYEHEATALYRANVIEHAPPIVREMGAAMVVRTVFGLAGLRDKLLALRAGLDDVALEVLKLDLMRAHQDLGLIPRARPRLRAVETTRLQFSVAGRDEVLEVPRAALDEIVTNPLEWSVATEAVSRGPYVDVGRLLIPGRDEGGSLPNLAFP